MLMFSRQLLTLFHGKLFANVNIYNKVCITRPLKTYDFQNLKGQCPSSCYFYHQKQHFSGNTWALFKPIRSRQHRGCACDWLFTGTRQPATSCPVSVPFCRRSLKKRSEIRFVLASRVNSSLGLF
jgi:hypothetical protein